MISQVAFLVLAALTLGAAVGVVVARSVFVSALYLVGAFVGVAGLYVLLGAGFLATVQVLVYVGAIAVLILFGVMLTRNIMAEERPVNSQGAVALVVAVALFAVLAAVARQTDWPLSEGAVLPASGGTVVLAEGPAASAAGERPGEGVAGGGTATGVVVPGPTEGIGQALMTDYLLAFEVAGAILLVALVGAIVIARE